MDDREIRRVFDQVKLSPEREEAMLERLLSGERSERPMKPIKKTAAVLVAAALMLMVCAFTVVTGLDQRILDYFGGAEEEAQQVSSGVVGVEQSLRYTNGWTIHIEQVLADRYSLAVLAEVVAPEGTALDGENYYFELGMEVTPQVQEQEGMGSWGYGPVLLEDQDPEDNRLTFLCYRGPAFDRDSGAQELTGQSVTLSPQWLQESGGKKLQVDFLDEEQSCTVKLPEQDSGRTYTLNASIQVGEETMTLNELYLSPISMAFSLQGAGDDPRLWGPSEVTGMEEEAVLHLAGGETVTMQRVVSQTHDQNTGVVHSVFQTDAIIAPEDVVSVTLLGQTFSLEGLTPLEN